MPIRLNGGFLELEALVVLRTSRRFEIHSKTSITSGGGLISSGTASAGSFRIRFVPWSVSLAFLYAESRGLT